MLKFKFILCPQLIFLSFISIWLLSGELVKEPSIFLWVMIILLIDLVTVFDAISTSRQTCEKLRFTVISFHSQIVPSQIVPINSQIVSQINPTNISSRHCVNSSHIVPQCIVKLTYVRRSQHYVNSSENTFIHIPIASLYSDNIYTFRK